MDIRDARIDAGLDEISGMMLCELPGDESWSVDVFTKRTKVAVFSFYSSSFPFTQVVSA